MSQHEAAQAHVPAVCEYGIRYTTGLDKLPQWLSAVHPRMLCVPVARRCTYTANTLACRSTTKSVGHCVVENVCVRMTKAGLRMACMGTSLKAHTQR